MSAELTTSDYTQDQARRFTDEIKRDGAALWQKVAEAYDGRIWVALGYQSGQAGWQQYIADEFPDGLLIPPKERQNDAIQHYLSNGMSTRAIAQVTDLSQQTVVRRAQELRKASGDSNESPGNVQGIDGKQYANGRPDPHGSGEVVDAEILDEGERRGAPTGQSGDSSGSNGQLGDDGTDAGAYGFAALNLESGGDALQLKKKETVTNTIRAFNGSGSSDTAQINGTATELMEHMTSGLVPTDIWDEDDLFEVADAAVATVSVLTDLLLCMARPNQTEGVSRSAITNSEVPGSVADLVLKVEDLVDALNRESSVL